MGVPVWFTWFFFIGAALIVTLIVNEDKLLELEAKYDKRKAERGVHESELSDKKG